VAGAPIGVAGRLALSMLAIQIAIGAVNDWVDAPRDASEKPRKPIPAGLTSPRVALALAGTAALLGLGLSALSGLATAGLAALGLSLGLAYDLRLSHGRWSWAPLALALPLLPIHGWLGATGTVPQGLLPLVPTGMLAGAGLALANGLVDLERDARSKRPTIAVELGFDRAWLVHLGLLVAVGGLAVLLAPAVPPGTLPGEGRPGILPADVLRELRTWGVALGIAALALGALALRAARPAIRERGWELEAVGIAGVGLGWVAGTAVSAGATPDVAVGVALPLAAAGVARVIALPGA